MFEHILAALSGGLQGANQQFTYEQAMEEERRRLAEARAEREAERNVARVYQEGRDRLADQRYADDRRVRDAGVRASLLDVNDPIDAETFGALEGTPYESAVQTTQTLPMRSNAAIPITARPTTPQGQRGQLPITAREPAGTGPSVLDLVNSPAARSGIDIRDPGGQVSRTFMGTPEQRQAAAAKQRTQSVLDTLSRTNPSAARGAAARAAGVNVTDAALMTDDERRAAAEAATPPQTGSFEDYVLRKYGKAPTAAQIVQARKDYQQADDRPTGAGAGERPMTQGQRANLIRSYQRDWNRAVAPVMDRRAQTAKLDAGLSALGRGERPAATEIILIAFEKMQDETSVVREGEYGRPGEMQSLRDRISAAISKLRSGGSNLTDENLKSLAAEGKAMAGELDKVSDRHLADFRQGVEETLDEFGIQHSRVFGQSEIGRRKADAPAPAATVKMRAPDGVEKDVPADQVEHFKARGATVVR
jgi:hypothetical protein